MSIKLIQMFIPTGNKGCFSNFLSWIEACNWIYSWMVYINLFLWHHCILSYLRNTVLTKHPRIGSIIFWFFCGCVIVEGQGLGCRCWSYNDILWCWYRSLHGYVPRPTGLSPLSSQVIRMVSITQLKSQNYIMSWVGRDNKDHLDSTAWLWNGRTLT